MQPWLSFIRSSLACLCAVALLFGTTAAQEENNGESVDTPKPSDLNRSHRFTPPGWPLEFKLPQSGVLHIRGDKDWSADEVDFLWNDHDVNVGSGAIYRIEGVFMPLEFDPLSVKYQGRDPIFDFCWSWLADSLHGKIVSSRKDVEILNLRWEEFRVEQPVPPRIDGTAVKLSSPPLKYYLYASPMRKGMIVVRFYYDDPPLPSLPRQIAEMLRYPKLPAT